jgi:hypothetical protein
MPTETRDHEPTVAIALRVNLEKPPTRPGAAPRAAPKQRTPAKPKPAPKPKPPNRNRKKTDAGGELLPNGDPIRIAPVARSVNVERLE